MIFWKVALCLAISGAGYYIGHQFGDSFVPGWFAGSSVSALIASVWSAK